LPWRRSSFPLIASASTVAVLPVTVNPITRVKTSNRLATALGYGVPAVADRLPSYEPYEGAVAFGSFRDSVVCYLQDRTRRERDVAIGRRIAAGIFGKDVVTGQWCVVVERALQRRAAAGT
jgi:hypothetical protein